MEAGELLPVTYKLYGKDTDDSWTHPEWIRTAINDVLVICGAVEYEVPELTAITDTTDGTYSYDDSTRTITMYATDRSLVGPH